MYDLFSREMICFLLLISKKKGIFPRLQNIESRAIEIGYRLILDVDFKLIWKFQSIVYIYIYIYIYTEKNVLNESTKKPNKHFDEMTCRTEFLVMIEIQFGLIKMPFLLNLFVGLIRISQWKYCVTKKLHAEDKLSWCYKHYIITHGSFS